MNPDPEGPKTCNTASKKNQDITNFDWTEAEKYCHFYAMPYVGISQINHFFNDC
jgi:hypothetical protein